MHSFARRLLPLFTIASLTAGCAYWTDETQGAATPKAETTSEATAAAEPAAPTKMGHVDAPASSPKPATSPSLRIVGSSTIGASLVPDLARAYLTRSGARNVETRDDDKAQKRITITGTASDKPLAIEIDYPGSSAAFECLVQASCDVGMSSRPISPDELARFKTPPTEHVLAMDGIAVIVNRNNKVNALTVDQISKAFRGEVTNWSELGGAPGAISVYGRDKSSGTFESMNQLALGGRGISAPNAKLLDDNDAVSLAVTNDERGLGFVALPYVKQTKAVAVRDGDAQPLVPSAFSVQTEDYAFSRRLFFYTTDHLSTLGGDFVDFALSDEGQKLVARAGFVSQQVSAQDTASVPPSAPPTYAKATSGAHRLSFDFRFRPATADLDVKAKRDLSRLAAFVKGAKSKLVLLGFADNQGDESKNVELSKLRAQSVSMELGKLGVAADVVDGVGSALPVAPNSTPEGRLRNRRVEVWVK